MGITYERAPAEVAEQTRRVMRQFHRELVEVETKVAVLFARSPKDEHGRPLAAAVTVGGYPCAAKVKVIPLIQRADGRADAEIVIDEDQWNERSEPEHDALLDHELHHLEVARDADTGNPLSDDLGRPKLRLRKHDHQFGWFDVIARRHGDAAYEIQQAKAFADNYGQTYFGWTTPPSDGSETKRATAEDAAAAAKAVSPLANLVGKDKGITSITMSAGGQSVTIDEAAAKRIRKAAAALA